MPSYTRRQTLAALGVAGISLAGCLSRTRLDTVEGRWPTAGHDPGQTRTVENGPADPVQAWTTEFDNGEQSRTPAIAGGRAYVPVRGTSRRDQASGDRSSGLYALDATTGEQRWRVPLRFFPYSPPSISGNDNRIVLSGQLDDDRGRIVAFDEDGVEKWLYDTDTELSATPITDGTTVYLPTVDGTVHALDIYSGQPEWARQVVDEEVDWEFTRPPALHNETLYLASYSRVRKRSGLFAIDAETGTRQWSRSLPVARGPVVDDRSIVVVGASRLAALDHDGVVRWTVDDLDGSWDWSSSLALDDQQVYVRLGRWVHAVDRREKRQVWSSELAANGRHPPTVVGEEVLVYANGNVTALGRSTGEPQWSIETDGPEVVVTSQAMVTSGAGRVTAWGE